MTYNELMSNEKSYYEKLSEDERKIYRASFEQLAVLATSTDRTVLEFVDVARAYEELSRLHTRYNDIQEKVYLMPNATATQQELYNSVYEASEELFSYTLSIGRFSAVITFSDNLRRVYRDWETDRKSVV